MKAIKTLFVVLSLALLAVDGNNTVLYTPPVPQDNTNNPIYKDAGPDIQGKRGDIDDKDFDSRDEEYNDIDNSDVDVDDRVIPTNK